MENEQEETQFTYEDYEKVSNQIVELLIASKINTCGLSQILKRVDVDFYARKHPYFLAD